MSGIDKPSSGFLVIFISKTNNTIIQLTTSIHHKLNYKNYSLNYKTKVISYKNTLLELLSIFGKQFITHKDELYGMWWIIPSNIVKNYYPQILKLKLKYKYNSKIIVNDKHKQMLKLIIKSKINK